MRISPETRSSRRPSRRAGPTNGSKEPLYSECSNFFPWHFPPRASKVRFVGETTESAAEKGRWIALRADADEARVWRWIQSRISWGILAFSLLLGCGGQSKKQPEPRSPYAGPTELVLGHVRIVEARLLPRPDSSPHYRVTLANESPFQVKGTLSMWFFTERGSRLLYPDEAIKTKIDLDLDPAEERTFEGRSPFYSARFVKLEALPPLRP